MTWVQIITLLACPLMMLFCMKGMFSGNKDRHDKTVHQQASPTELQQLQIKMGELMEQNHHLLKEIQSIKEKDSSSKVVDYKDGKREIS
ncbi:DUF2933 domain-containing protein [Brevibacillus centrosporus]|uniref:DUF2933 domain-containing protein n=1 Tax=Brevibacillus centrosporus TaxID=54910 RepID=UPI001141F6AE|nr:DUF2933 domain-containing protein [Brevibacillus centrosporus]MEC2127818.1 DUF2933 domain-containing protein [Brevibacillus centrosporus]GED32057.1 hypothetical protein BCE02nite_31980 [Brevibacillus centrosporus]